MRSRVRRNGKEWRPGGIARGEREREGRVGPYVGAKIMAESAEASEQGRDARGTSLATSGRKISLGEVFRVAASPRPSRQVLFEFLVAEKR